MMYSRVRGTASFRAIICSLALFSFLPVYSEEITAQNFIVNFMEYSGFPEVNVIITESGQEIVLIRKIQNLNSPISKFTALVDLAAHGAKSAKPEIIFLPAEQLPVDEFNLRRKRYYNNK